MSAQPEQKPSEEPAWLREIKARCEHNAKNATAAQKLRAQNFTVTQQRLQAQTAEIEAKRRARVTRTVSDKQKADEEARWEATLANPPKSLARPTSAAPVGRVSKA